MCFSLLSGNYISQSMELNPLVIGCNCFRPLSGNYISQCYKASLRKSTHIHVSVPCRGTTFLNSNERLTVKSVSKFPSPVGELHFSMQLKRSLLIILGFRPLSGNYISQSVFMDLDRIARGRVSVPCRGTTFLNMVQITLSLMKHTEFPSPVGELHFSMVHMNGEEVRNGFRPLSGNYISQFSSKAQ